MVGVLFGHRGRCSGAFVAWIVQFDLEKGNDVENINARAGEGFGKRTAEKIAGAAEATGQKLDADKTR